MNTYTHAFCFFHAQVTSYKLALRMEAEVVGGPTAQGQPPFEWGNSFPEFERVGMPDRFDFSFERQTAADLPFAGVECSSSNEPHVAAADALRMPADQESGVHVEQL